MFEKMSFDKKTKKFSKWPILLKDVLTNLHNEIIDCSQSSNQDKNSVNLGNQGSNQKQSMGQMKVTKVTQIASKTHDVPMTSNTTKVVDDSKDITVHEQEKSSNEVSNIKKESLLQNDNLVEENKEFPDETHNDFGIDMNWNEVLDDVEKLDSVTVKTVISPNNEAKICQTAEKVSDVTCYVSDHHQISSFLIKLML